MPEHEHYTDPKIGTATWDNAQGDWVFTLVLPSGRAVEGTIRPADDRIPLAAPEMAESLACVRWVKEHEPALQQLVADRMYRLMLDWHNEESGSPLSKDEFRDKISLLSVSVLEDHRACLYFDDAELFGGHTIKLTVGAEGELKREPHLIG